ncbi:MAG: hypothetical protein IPM24_05905 [Bryobacterales bacterium]|nr:hypothetical protein [Bryobacterales bacterium]
MTDSTRAHKRIERTETPGTRHDLSLGTLLVASRAPRKQAPLVIHFHGPAWLVEASVRRRWRRAASLSVHLGTGSAVYAAPFREAGRFGVLLDEVERATGRPWAPVVLTAYSAGYGAVREILRDATNRDKVQAVILADGIHAGYDENRLAKGADLEPFLAFAREAAGGNKQFILTHSEVYPGTYASTTDCADFLVDSVRVRRRAVLRWGPLGMQQVSEVRRAGWRVMGFAGNSAPDHTDHLHALADWLKLIR